jgi:hypothetical protein
MDGGGRGRFRKIGNTPNSSFEFGWLEIRACP